MEKREVRSVCHMSVIQKNCSKDKKRRCHSLLAREPWREVNDSSMKKRHREQEQLVTLSECEETELNVERGKARQSLDTELQRTSVKRTRRGRLHSPLLTLQWEDIPG